MLVRHHRVIRCLLVGYNGTGNTGSDIRLLTAIDDVRAAFGEQTLITVLSIDPERTAAILPQDDRIKVVRLSLAPFSFIPRSWRLARQHDVTILIEGSTFTQSWSPWLIHAYLWSAKHALCCGNYAVAYAVDAGKLSPFHAFFTRWIVNGMSLVITRTEQARERLLEIGVSRPVITNTDTAFQYVAEEGPLRNRRPTIGVAPVEFFHWPVKLKLWDRPENRYRWPFSFTWSPERRKQSAEMVENYVRLLKHIHEHHDYEIKLIAMEDVDIRICERIQQALPPEVSRRVSLLTSRQAGPRRVVAVLRGLDALVTSRYHASVLSMENAVPQMAVAHDERLKSIYAEMGIASKYLIDCRDPELGKKLIQTFELMIENRHEVSTLIGELLNARYRPLCLKNRSDLKDWGRSVFDSVTPEEDKVRGVQSQGRRPHFSESQYFLSVRGSGRVQTHKP